MRFVLHRLFVFILLGLSLACQPVIRPPTTLTPVQVVAPTPTVVVTPTTSNPPTPGERIDIGGRSLFLTCLGEGSPTVILEAGLGGGHSSWALVQPGAAQFARVCSYDRAGIGMSDPAPTPRTSQAVVADLHALLGAANMPGPYILVGHSFGALHVRLYTHTYPDEVIGLVLVDPVHEDWWSRAAALIPPASAEDSERLQSFRRFMTEEVNDPTRTPEGINIPASAAQVRATGSLGKLPLIVVKAGIQDILAPGLPPDLEVALTQLLQTDLPEELAALSTLSIKLDVPDSGHDIPQMQPDAVVVAIRTMIDVSRLSGR
jgi:pimeloyl-ACP methyl ester carboxylesterase